ncbi:hypothetical protein C5167_007778 [Papaver somniferum]|nr:hypothetical protein C5167_007778 [Papaver somniferum]
MGVGLKRDFVWEYGGTLESQKSGIRQHYDISSRNNTWCDGGGGGASDAHLKRRFKLTGKTGL